MFDQPPPDDATSDPSCLTLTLTEAARLVGVSPRHWSNLVAREKAPQPFRLGRSVRWNRKHVVSWVNSKALDAKGAE